MGVLDTLNKASQATKSVTLCLDSGLQAEYDRLLRELEEAAAEDERMQSFTRERTRVVVDQMDKVRERMAASEVTFEFRALDWAKRLTLQANHPPRKGNMVDQVRGHNAETFTPAIIKACCVAVTDADGDRATKIPVKTWSALLGKLNLSQVSSLYAAASQVNDQASSVPSSARFLLESQDSEAGYKLHSPGTSPRKGTTAGSRSSSPKSNTAKTAESSGS